MRRRARTSARGTALVLGALLLAGCSGGTVEPVAPDVVADQIADALEDEVGVRPVVSCTEELPAEVGAEVVCDLTTAGDPETIYPVTATVTAVDTETGRVNFDVEVAEAPSGSEAPPTSPGPTGGG